MSVVRYNTTVLELKANPTSKIKKLEQRALARRLIRRGVQGSILTNAQQIELLKPNLQRTDRDVELLREVVKVGPACTVDLVGLVADHLLGHTERSRIAVDCARLIRVICSR